uniref:Uncharacterized protein n=1 Tax=Chromera velia CCMP2878 TaxID=1169474 RepID=A0A0G4FYC9_9ALVE|eukprot:Cvel_19297.t1-p1 / transcript=Cvel_19297.t1 / gene=Cvel_19297 / organism=Chromera_velia_CCMP2878 / gene_product=hypothetical protein / transcript_product=hypothetical protein / location=Cvel_scaffold1652:35397-36317(+) / protein_length=307 / sequence_SO=supercontig / SO=protein_coding / is_pseudo=false
MQGFLDPQVVAERVAERLWNDEGQRFPFLVAGSYPAAVRAHRHNPPLSLAYNDIDVWHVDPNRPEQPQGQVPQQPDTWTIYSNDRIPNVLPPPFNGIDINRMIVPGLFWESRIQNFDINCVMAKFFVRPKPLPEGNGGPQTEIVAWHSTNAFENFLQHRVIACVNSVRSPAASLIRLLCKSHQMNLPYELSDEHLNRVPGRRFGGSNIVRFHNLPQNLRDEITQRFDIVPIPSSPGFQRMLLRNAPPGEGAPEPQAPPPEEVPPFQYEEEVPTEAELQQILALISGQGQPQADGQSTVASESGDEPM